MRLRFRASRPPVETPTRAQRTAFLRFVTQISFKQGLRRDGEDKVWLYSYPSL
ncbi:hypothetical protein HanXRQr2_Chr08g0329011 [Helianthus annuus]|uniref:Uncharacterized protein n=1 Tax=Helianthus annuus TaxID=4232 RepID=A0A251U3P3_HELAN|nr:hypothetical protein HanXRQr2_Chr08g0329011 [Helianthus annuus]KAJ0900818.1 hypothetical protein HanPSC8_Chr08g0318071 [Helianthus annuus]